MAFDVIFARALARELDSVLAGGRVEKVYQPSRDELILVCHIGRDTKRLVLSASPSSARVGLTEKTFENPAVPPMLCMLLRKHLAGAVIESVRTLGFERVIVISFSCRDEMGFACKKCLITEVMGNYSNIIFTSDEGDKMKIIGVMRTVDFQSSRVRQVISGMSYTPPPSQMKADPLTETREGFEEKYCAYKDGRGADKFLVDTYTGFSPLTAREVVYRAGSLRQEKLWEAFSELIGRVKRDEFEPNLVISENGDALDFSFEETRHLGKSEKMQDFSSLLDRFFGEKEAELSLKNRIGATKNSVVSIQKRLIKKVGVLEDEIASCKDADTYRLWGDLLTASLYKLSGKMKEAEVENYYATPPAPTKIPLDEKLSPSQNASRYYKKYTKLKTARVAAGEQLEKTRAEIEYLSSVLASLEMCESSADVSEVREELRKTGYLSSPEGTAKKPKPSAPLHFVTSGGRDVYCGKNNVQNDILTLKTAEKSDYWFHVKGGAGSHVIMKCAPEEDPDACDFTEAAQIAAYYSDAKSSENVPVDYTRARFVKKPSGAAPGHVIYTDYYTAYVKPNASAEKRIAENKK